MVNINTYVPRVAFSVEALPKRLVNFFARYPPHLHSSAVRRPPEGTPPLSEVPPPPSPYTPDRDAKGAKGVKKNEWSASRALLVTSQKVRNPFLPHKRNGQWESPKYGLRQQADLMKLAIKYNVQTCLPPSRKSPEFKATRLKERGLQVKGTGIGQKVKGHEWERTMESRLEDRRKAMEGMPEMVRTWKQVSSCLSFSLAPLTRQPREAMDVDGRNGPGSNGNRPGKILQRYGLVSIFGPFALFDFSMPYWLLNCIHINTCTSHSRSLGWCLLSTNYVQYNLQLHTRCVPKMFTYHIQSLLFDPGKESA